ncbi:flagellar basal body rod protein FlgC [Agaribacter flavus]|uniref:Flagellar basal body rod protein FlgC n=1 Tax=Agaribacter flavus TaxID=1902781 RepID=A0ABV7FRQ1_9ALTE
MAVTEVMNVSDYGMYYQKMRIDAATINLANANIVQPTNGKGFQPLTVQLDSSINSSSFDKEQVKMQELNTPDRKIFQPDHPMADIQGFVRYTNIDVAEQMVILTEATRAYEANVKAFNAQMSINSKALEIGK